MQEAPIPKNEEERVSALLRLGLLDTPPEERFDRLTKTATLLFEVPISTLTFVDAKREWFKSVCGLEITEGERAVSFCGHALLSDDVFVIPDTTKDPRFADNPMVVGKPFIRFYAGVPLKSADGERVGVFCIKDIRPRDFPPKDILILRVLAELAEVEINKRNVLIDVAQYQKYEAIIRENEERFRSVIENMRDVFWITDISDSEKMAYVSPAFKDIWGREPAELYKNPRMWIEAIHEDDTGRVEALFNAFIAEGKDFDIEYRIINKDNETRWIHDKGVRILDGKGKAVRIAGVARDITKEKAIDKEKSDFIFVASHQLKTPLATIKWCLELAQKHDATVTEEERKQYLKEANNANERLIHLMDDLLNVSRIEFGTFVTKEGTADVAAAIDKSLDALRSPISEKHLVISKEFPAEPALANAEPEILEIILENLLANAVTYTPPQGQITVALRRGGSDVRIVVSDTGCGIPESQQKNIFSRLFRADNARLVSPGGTGLGLYIVKKLLDGLHGSISFASKENQGTRFDVVLPANIHKGRRRGVII